jgi:hypothetical protein
MRRQEIEATLTAAYPVDRERIERLDIEVMEADLLADLDDAPAPAAEAPTRGRPSRRRGLGLGLAGAVLAAAVLAVVLLTGGSAEQPTKAYGAELIRFAESGPLLLLDGPEWGVRDVSQDGGTGRINFTEKSPEPHPDEAIETRAEMKRHETPPAVIARRQRFMELVWRDGDKSWTTMPAHPVKVKIPALGVTAEVDPHTERAWDQGGPGDRLMVAVWKEGGRAIELRGSVPDLAAFRERLAWLRRVGAEEWLDAMPARVTKSVDYVATVESMLEGIPRPPGFDPAKLEEAEVTTDRYQVGAAVGGAVACSWFRTWGEALASGDAAGAAEAEAVLQGSGSWPIFREMAKEGAYPATVLEYARAMPSRRWYHRPLLPQVNEGLCGGTGYPAIAPGGQAG